MAVSSRYLSPARLPRARNEKALLPVNIARSSQTIASSTWADITNASGSITWTSGLALIICTVSGFQSSSSPWGGVYSYRIHDGTSVLAGGAKWMQAIGPIQVHQAITFLDLVELPRGTYTVKIQWQRTSGTGTLETDTNDIAMLTIVPQT